MSSKKDNGAVFPPYVPFLGDRFRECGIHSTDFETHYPLNSGKKDVNPDYGMGKFPKEEREAYWALNDALVEQELMVVQPRVVLSFRGRKLKKLNELSKTLGYKLFAINDPAWILRGGSGKLKPGASWHNEYDRLDDSVRNLIDSYIGYLQDQYVCKAEGVKAYLAHYYNVFEN
ncbi:hypothetical protein [Fibrobacter sp. UWEL]|uniref:hypothetical protein n=1 Tax=Fibrobacter sp. UWEL TaxID=1896209 RepID=UPI001160ABFF|nr:hypothetical protein [Fibrobacter sp. UWEL]